ncbi:hypothetical protein APSETT444_003560 [Aspergillus pseudonomiae]
MDGVRVREARHWLKPQMLFAGRVAEDFPVVGWVYPKEGQGAADTFLREEAQLHAQLHWEREHTGCDSRVMDDHDALGSHFLELPGVVVGCGVGDPDLGSDESHSAERAVAERPCCPVGLFRPVVVVAGFGGDVFGEAELAVVGEACGDNVGCVQLDPGAAFDRVCKERFYAP